MQKGSTLFLKTVLILIAAVALVAMLWFPQLEGRANDLDLISIYKDPFIIYLYMASIPFFFGIYQAFKLLGYIEANKTFSSISVKALRNIKYCAFAFSGFIAGAVLYVFIMSRTTTEDGAGAMVIGMVTLFASVVIATAAGVFQNLLQSAVEIKSENDLTV